MRKPYGGKNMKNKYMLPPCPSYDVEGTESWLADMASEGWMLRRDGFFAGIASFERAKPQKVRYRLDAALHSTSMWADGGGAPDEEAVETAAEWGWEYVAVRGQFYIYRAPADGVREFHTDPRVQSIAVNEVRKRERASLITTAFWLCAYPVFYLRGNLLLTVLEVGTPFALFTLGILLWILIGSFVRVWTLRKLRLRLLAGESLHHGKAWRRKSALYRAKKLAFLAFAILWAVWMLSLWSADVLDEGKIPLASYAGDPPFATIADFGVPGSYRRTELPYTNTVQSASDPLAPVMVVWQENATVTLADGRVISGGLYVYYFELASPVLAREAARELTRQKQATGREREELSLSLPSLDSAYAFADLFPTVVLRQGKTVLRAEFFQTSEEQLDLNEWAGILAENIRLS